MSDVRTAASDVWKAFRSRDRRRILGVLTEDVEWIAPKGNATAVALGVPDHMTGGDAIADFILNELPKLFDSGIAITPKSVTAEGDTVVFEQTQRATLSNRRAYENDDVFVLEMQDGKARRIREYRDTRKGYDMVFDQDPPGRIVA